MRKLPVLLLCLILSSCVESEDEVSGPGAAEGLDDHTEFVGRPVGSQSPAAPRVRKASRDSSAPPRSARREEPPPVWQPVTKGPRPQMLFFTAEWCMFCHQMASEAFNDPTVIRLAQSFQCVWVDADQEPQAVQRYSVESFPTVVFVGPSGEELLRVQGKQQPAQFARLMQQALARANRQESAARSESVGYER